MGKSQSSPLLVKQSFDKPQQDARSIITVYGLNVEKFQAPESREIFDRIWTDGPDLICLQETKRAVTDLSFCM